MWLFGFSQYAATNRPGPAPQTQKSPIGFSAIWIEPKVFIKDINQQ